MYGFGLHFGKRLERFGWDWDDLKQKSRDKLII